MPAQLSPIATANLLCFTTPRLQLPENFYSTGGHDFSRATWTRPVTRRQPLRASLFVFKRWLLCQPILLPRNHKTPAVRETATSASLPNLKYCHPLHSPVFSRTTPEWPAHRPRKKEKIMKILLLLFVAVVLFFCPSAKADGVDNFVWSSIAGETFSWSWLASASDSQFTFLEGGRIFMDGNLMYDAYLTVSPCDPLISGGCVDGLMSNISFSCVSDPRFCDAESVFSENFAAPFFTDPAGVITFVPGTYAPAPGLTDQWEATLTITPAPEPGSLQLLLAGLAMLFFCTWLRKTPRIPRAAAGCSDLCG